MKKITEIVPASPGWYARWRYSADRTVTYPVAVWGLTADDDEEAKTGRCVVGVDSEGQWPGGENHPGNEFVRYIFRPIDAGMPVDIFNPCTTCAGGNHNQSSWQVVQSPSQ